MNLFEDNVITIDVGARLRQLRLERTKSMRALARSSGLSTNALSMIERGRTSPSVSTLYKLAEALEVPITAFFRLEPPRHDIVFRRAEERKRVSIHNGWWEGLGGEAFTGQIEPFMLTLQPGAGSGPDGMMHTGSEMALCVAGQVEYEVENRKFVLCPGDTLMFLAQLRHRWTNIGNDAAQLVIVLTGFQQAERPSEYHLSSGKHGDRLSDDDLIEKSEDREWFDEKNDDT